MSSQRTLMSRRPSVRKEHRVIDSQIGIEQTYLTALYDRVDAMREEAAAQRTPDDDPTAAAFWQAEVRRLDAVEEGLYFGRLDLHDGSRVHIGRLGLFQDEDDEPLLVDWRAPVAQAFYTATPTAPQGVHRRRRITTRGRKVVALDDELLDTTGHQKLDDTLVGEAALLAEVTADRTGRMRDIVTTLQAEQDRIVRDGHAGVLVVQGGPGTGKTAVALHRVAYLLYTRPHLRDRGVLVIGPNRIYLDYIGQVLPGLGENSVVTATIPELCPGIEASRTDPPDIAERKGRADMAEHLADAVRSRVRIPEMPLCVEFEQQVLRLDPQDCRQAERKARRSGLPHNQARLVFHREVVDTLASRLIENLEAVVLTDTGEALDGGSPDGRLGEADLRALKAAGVVLDQQDHEGQETPRSMLDEADRAALRDTLLADSAIQRALDELWPSLTPQQVVSDLLHDPAPGWSTADVPLLDEAITLLDGATAFLGGTADPLDGATAELGQITHDQEPYETSRWSTFGHIVVDEAQELSEMAWRMLMRRCPTRSMTIVGDLAQTGTRAGASTWTHMLRPHVGDRWRLAELTVNYRTPAEIMEATTDLLAAHHPDLRPPRSVREAGETPWRTTTTLAALPDTVARLAAAHATGQLAVIAPSTQIETLTVALSLPSAAHLTDRVVLLTPEQTKGLEFDTVLIADPAAILDATPLGHNDLYVAMTRATRRLGIVHPGPPPAEVSAMRTNYEPR
jgi:DNA helicase IV